MVCILSSISTLKNALKMQYVTMQVLTLKGYSVIPGFFLGQSGNYIFLSQRNIFISSPPWIFISSPMGFASPVDS